jgi:D-alanyl-D-alanine carboxypeptidase
MKLEDKLGWGSTTKMFTAVAILNLLSERNISLDAVALPYMDPFFRKIKNGTSLVNIFGDAIRNVTIRQLLSMRSGVHDYDEKSRSYQMEHMLLDLGPDLMLSRIFIDEGKGFDFSPGTQGEYSSSNFVLLGLMLAQAAGLSGWDKYRQETAFPSDLMGSMKFAIHGPCSRDEYQPMAHGLTIGNPLVNLTLPKDAYKMSCLNGWTCGNLLSTGLDVARWTQALFTTEQLVPKETLAEMLKMQALTVGWESKEKLLYGLGLMDVSLNTAEPHGSGKFVGHGGETIGFNSMTGYMKDVNTTLAVAGNMDPYIVPIRLVTLQSYHAIIRAFNCPLRRWWQSCH